MRNLLEAIGIAEGTTNSALVAGRSLRGRKKPGRGKCGHVTAYQRVRAEITKPGNAGIPNFGTAPIPSIKVTGPLFKPYEYKPDPAVQRAISAGIGARIGQDMRRAQDIAAYGRNPMARCGVPPH
jgi:hypothetical protein